MKCSSCGKTVRSTHQCAHCGEVFTSKTFEQEPVVPKTKSKRKKGIFSAILSILKIVLALLVVFVMFLYGPRYVTKVMNYFGMNQQQTQPESESVEESSQELVAENTLKLTSHKVDTAAYPIVQVQMEFEQPLDDVTKETFEFATKVNGEQKALSHYSLVKDGNTLTLRFNDANLANAPKAQTLEIFASEFGFTNTINYELPDQTAQAETLTTINEILAEIPNAKVAFGEADGKIVYTNTASTEASSTISWFVLHRVFEAVQANELTLDKAIQIEASLTVANENSVLKEQETATVQELVNAVIQAQDVTAMNHLIQAVGGPNAFNQWLKQKDYFATELVGQLDVTEQGSITGANTNVQDIAKVLVALDRNTLVSQTADAQLKEALLQSSLTEKFPATAAVARRYELATLDTDTKHQHYAAIYETEGKHYIVVVLVDQVNDAPTVVSQVATTIQSLLEKVAKLEVAQEEVIEEAQVEIYEEPVQVYEEVYEEQPVAETYTEEPVAPSEP
ncbi:MAG: serine hydrolase [Aerococcaceae bacterium]|nr:serine hydrolase [Aerococcaceae bacterium]